MSASCHACMQTLAGAVGRVGAAREGYPTQINNSYQFYLVMYLNRKSICQLLFR